MAEWATRSDSNRHVKEYVRFTQSGVLLFCACRWLAKTNGDGPTLSLVEPRNHFGGLYRALCDQRVEPDAVRNHGDFGKLAMLQNVLQVKTLSSFRQETIKKQAFVLQKLLKMAHAQLMISHKVTKEDH